MNPGLARVAKKGGNEMSGTGYGLYSTVLDSVHTYSTL